jgi:hypothetical protein
MYDVMNIRQQFSQRDRTISWEGHRSHVPQQVQSDRVPRCATHKAAGNVVMPVDVKLCLMGMRIDC